MRLALCVIAFGLLAGGCGSGGGAVLPVNGIVTLDDQPLDGAAVTFFPDDKQLTTGGTAQTGSDGKFVILGPKGERGLAPGRYKVTVNKGKSGVTDEPVIAAPTEVELRDDFPPRYSDPARTELAFSVIGDGAPIKIELSSKKKK